VLEYVGFQFIIVACVASVILNGFMTGTYWINMTIGLELAVLKCCYTTNAMLICILSYPGTSFALCFLCGDRYVGDGETDRREILHDGTYWSQTGLLPHWAQYPQSKILAV